MTEPTFWSRVASFARKYILAPLPLLLLVVGAVVLIVLGFKNIQIGGLIGKILGRKGSSPRKAIDVANSIPEDRVDAEGNVLPPGTPDSRGITQAKVVELKKPGIFDDPSKVKIEDPNTGEFVDVDLPVGVKANDVEKILIVSPEVTAVTVKRESKITAKDVDTLLDKYKDYL